MLSKILAILLACLLANNYTIVHFLGISSTLKTKKHSIKSNGLNGLFSTALFIVMTLIMWPLDKYVLANVSYLQVFVSTVILLAIVYALKAALKNVKCFDFLDFIEVTVSILVLGLCVNIASLTFVEAIFTALFVGLAYTAVSIIYSSLYEHIDQRAVPAAFKGLPIELLIAGMMALAFLAF